jgi:putative ABC transport system ATP-binding protein
MRQPFSDKLEKIWNKRVYLILNSSEKRELIRISNAARIYSGPEGKVISALSEANLVVNEGEFVALIGPSGSGKTTLLQIIGALMQPDKGSVLINGYNIGEMDQKQQALFRNKYIGFIFQSFHLQPNWSCRDNVLLPMLFRDHPLVEASAAAGGMLNAVGLGAYIHHLPGQLSGGQKQRVAVARAMITQPPILLADEPTGNLDPKTGGEIINLILNLHKNRKTTVVVATHDEAIAEVAERKIYLSDGRIVG